MIFRHLSVRLRLAIGASSIVVSTLMLALFIGLIPDPAASIVSGRAQLCEVIAVYNSTMMVKDDLQAMALTLEAIATINSQIQSVGIRRSDGELVFQTDGHQQTWKQAGNSLSTVDQIHVPLLLSGTPWGTVEVSFQPITATGWRGILQQPWLTLPLVIGPTCCFFFWCFLGRTLKQLDPSSAVPGRVREALDGLAESLIVVDQKGVVRFANRAFTELVGMVREKVIGKSMTRLPWVDGRLSIDYSQTPSSDTSAEREMPWQRSQRDRSAFVGEVLELKAGDGSMRTLNVSCSPILGPDGVCRGVMICGDDITHLEDIKKQLRVAKDRADAASAAKSAFVANMSHEIRTPLNAVLGFADVLRRGMARNRDEEIEYLDLIHRSGRHLLELINNVLDLSKIESGHLQVESLCFAPHKIVHDVVSVLRPRALERGINLIASYESDLPDEIESDPTKLRQIITNLVGNAIKFTEIGCVTVHVSATNGRTPCLKIAIQDTGIGMTPEQQVKVFSAFEQADGSTTRRFGGTGLGLSISRQFAEALGGSLTVTSQENVGSTFIFDLPFSMIADVVWIPAVEIQSELNQQQVQSNHAPQVNLEGFSVLVADDGEENRRLISLILGRAGAEVMTVCDGREALRLISKNEFDVVLMDMQMPIINGYEATELIRSTGCEVPIIALTGNAMKGARQRCLDSGCTDFLTKPVHVDRLLTTVSMHLFKIPLAAGDAETESIGGAMTPTKTSRPGHDDSGCEQASDLLHDVSMLQELMNNALLPIHSTLPTDDPEMADIVCQFIPRMKQGLLQMEKALDAGDFEDLYQHAHWLKGSAATTGFPLIAKLASHLEVATAKRDCEACGAMLSIIDTAVRGVGVLTAAGV